MSKGITTLGVTFSYCVETTAGTKPSTGFTKIAGLASVPEFNPEPEQIETTTLDDTTWRTYEKGLRSVSGALGFSFNFTEEFMTAWDAMVSAAEALTGGKAMWFQINVPNLHSSNTSKESFFFTGTPAKLQLPAVGINENFAIDAYVTPGGTSTDWGWAVKGTIS